MTRRICMVRDDLFGLVVEPVRWPAFYNNLVGVKVDGPFLKPGDQVDFKYRMLGRLVDAEVRLTALEPPESLELEARITEAVISRQHWDFQSEDDRTLLSVRVEVDDVTDWFGVPVHRYAVARALQGDLSRTLDNLVDLVASGLV